MTTKTPHGLGSHEACAALVSYRGQSEPCKRAGSHPDSDGKRFWCGLHNPALRKKREEKIAARVDAETAARVDVETAVSNEVKTKLIDELMTALRGAQSSLIEISNAKDIGWPDTTDVSKYKVLLSHLNTLAFNAGEKLTGFVRKIEADIARAKRAA